jgi:hypothetical protein
MLKSMHGLTGLRLVLIYNFQLINIIVNKLLSLFKLVYLYTAQILLGQ